MAGATQKPKLGNVTVATVKERVQARQISAKLEAAGIKCFVNDERGVPSGMSKVRLGGITVQVERGDVARALQLLQQKDDHAAGGRKADSAPFRWFRFQLGIDSRIETLIQIIFILALAVFMAVVFFY